MMLLAFAEATVTVRSETLTLAPAADTTLFETNPDNNLGGEPTLVAGTTARGSRNRALVRFDLASQVPFGARISSASLQVQVLRTPSAGAVNSNFGLRRVLVDWGEGTKTGSTGRAATAGEATWKARLAPDSLWSAPGAVEGVDFSTNVSAVVAINGSGVYTFASTPELAEDVQFWLDHPDQNFGWLIMSDADQTAETARRIGSREDAANWPKLVVTFSIEAAPIQFTAITKSAAGVSLTWSRGAPPYQLKSMDIVVATNWTNYGSPLATNSVTVPAAGFQAFFRVAGAGAAP